MLNSLTKDYEKYLFHQGTNYRSYQLLGAHLQSQDGVDGVQFTVWAPRAKAVQVVGDFNNWQGTAHPMTKLPNSGIWTTFIPEVKAGDLYKYQIETSSGQVLLKADPYGYWSELRPHTASRVASLKYDWGDQQWQKQQQKKKEQASLTEPMLIYEVHLGSWKRKADGTFYNYGEIAHELIPYVVELGYTHLEIMPVMEHPLDASWGYQVTGYYGVTSRYGSPTDFMYLVDQCHQAGIGVILDWVPGHFCKDDHGLRFFDGTALYESSNPLWRENIQWDTLNFDFHQPEVWSFLISNAIFWLDMYHVDGIRVDAVANMLFLDYCKSDGQWCPNKYGGNENLEAVAFLKKLNQVVFQYYPQALMIAEESTTWPLVTKPVYLGGLGFNYKWNMGWMNDILRYVALDPIHRKWHHNLITFSFMYAFSENFVLPLSHDEVVHGKKSLLDKMPGDYWQKFAGLRLLYGYMMAHPGKKLLFMGGEFGQFIEWRDHASLDWHLLDYEMHHQLQGYVQKLNCCYRRERAFWEVDFDWRGFEWIDPHNYSQSIIAFMRKGKEPDNHIIVLTNFTPTVYHQYRVGVPQFTAYTEIFNSDEKEFGGSGQINSQQCISEKVPWHNQPYSIEIIVPPLATIYLKPVLRKKDIKSQQSVYK